ncbi:MAG: FoF1 ATP synthase subunit delta/epsilon [Planctomycetota bacterium]
MPHRRFHCEIYTPSEKIVESDAVSVKFPASDGQVGVLARRAPMVALLGVGEIFITGRDDSEQRYFVARGFARMLDDQLVFLAEQCTPTGKLDPEAAWEELQQAQRLPAQTDREIAAREAAIATARGRFNAARRYRRQRGLISKPMYEE